MSMWINTKRILKDNINKTKPCNILGWCPYGQLVEEFPLDNLKVKGKEVNCRLFGHHCPMFYHAENLSEGKKRGNQKGY